MFLNPYSVKLASSFFCLSVLAGCHNAKASDQDSTKGATPLKKEHIIFDFEQDNYSQYINTINGFSTLIKEGGNHKLAVTLKSKSNVESDFEFINPKEVARCGCGESFTI